MRHLGCLTLVLCALIAGSGRSMAAGDGFELLSLDGVLVKWGAGRLGSGAEVTYAFLDAPASFDDARNCRAMEPLDALSERTNATARRLRGEIEAAMAMWAAVADIAFRHVENRDQARLLIGADAGHGGFAYADVRHVVAPAAVGSAARIERALVCFNPARPWKLDFGGDASVYDLRYAAAHEIGHAIGLDHPGPSGQLMSFRYGEQFRALQSGDIAGAVRLYGARLPTVADAVVQTGADAAPSAGPASAIR
jgi:hypothetical protein